MPRRRRTSRTTRRSPRRPEFAAGPAEGEPREAEELEDADEAEEPTDFDGNPIFADDLTTGAPVGALGGATGPVETRPEWIATPERRRQPGRRTSQLRQRGTSEGAARIRAGQLPTFERQYIVNELRRIAVISSVLFAVVIVLAVVLR